MAKITKVSPFAPKESHPVFAIKGVSCSTTQCGFYKHKKDLCVFKLTDKSSVAGVFTKSLMASPPVLKCRENLKQGKASLLIVNSGNSFAMTGKKGEQAIEEILSEAAKEFSVPKEQIFIASTGVIGSLPDYSKIIKSFSSLKKSLSEKELLETAKTIMTTDTFPKVYSKKVQIGSKEVTITGMAKGSGMIEPNMATMLSFIFTDAKISSSELQAILNTHLETSFNAITVDSDTSTSDTLMLFATNQVGCDNINQISDAIGDCMQDLAKQIIMDGEGVQKFITINVIGSESDVSAKIVAKSIANSPLIKTAIAGSDPNWGRIAMAIGKTSEKVNHQKLTIGIGPYTIYENEGISSSYNEDNLYQYMSGAFVEINVNLSVSSGKATVWTCDLTHEYININTDYRS